MPEARRALMIQLMNDEFEAFMAALRTCPAGVFSTPPRTGHSLAWHALHVMDWTRATMAPDLADVDPNRTYGYLGFEDNDWIRAVTGPTLATEQDSQATVLKAVAGVLAEAQNTLRTAPAQRFTSEATFLALKKQRSVLDSLSYHLRHTAYHRGQVALVLKELQ